MMIFSFAAKSKYFFILLLNSDELITLISSYFDCNIMAYNKVRIFLGYMQIGYPLFSHKYTQF